MIIYQEMKKILVLGASGFLGRNFIANCVNINDIELTCLTKQGSNTLIRNQQINWLKGDLSDCYFSESLFDDSWDQIVNFYWEGLPIRNDSLNRINLERTKKIIDLIAKHGFFLNNIGSGLEFNPSINQIDDNSQDFATDNFAITKREIHAYLREANIEFRWIRPFYLYGQWQNSASLLASIVMAHKNKNEVKFRNPNLVHDFISVLDFSQALIALIQSKNSTGNFNIGSGVLTSVQAFADAAHSALNGIELKSKERVINYGICSSNLNMIQFHNWIPKFIGVEGVYQYVLKYRRELIDCFITP